MLQTFATCNWNETFSTDTQEEALENLEKGHILYFPHLRFEILPEENFFLDPKHADPHAKNISYHSSQNKLWGVQRLTDTEWIKLKILLDRFAQKTLKLVKTLLPHYFNELTIGRTSFRPIQLSDRKSSYRKDDKLLHFDAFPSDPSHGKRILRLFTNINPQGEAHIWRVSEPFENVVKQFLADLSEPMPGSAKILRFLRITKSYRTLYDHYMLQLHDKMKANREYQKSAPGKEIIFPPGSTWMMLTDQTSHALMKGQYILEQTFYVPINAMKNPVQSPLHILETMLGQRLV